MKLVVLSMTFYLLCLPLSSISLASDWREILSGRYIDVDNMHIIKDYQISYWVKQYDFETVPDGIKSIVLTQYKKYSHHTTNFEADCFNMKVRVADQIVYATDGSVLFSYTIPSQFTKVVPDSIGEAEFKFACTVYRYQTEPQTRKSAR